jgi:type I restriction enzyme S subunit
MGPEWTVVCVEDLKAPEENSLATGPFGSSIGSRFFEPQGVPVIRGSNLSVDVGTRLDEHGLAFVGPAKARECSRSTVHAGDLVFTCWERLQRYGLL